MARRILFGLLSPGLGGHTRTAVALACALRARGHAIDFLVDAAAATADDAAPETAALVHGAGFAVVPIKSPWRPSFTTAVADLIQRRQYDAVHWFELYAGVREAAMAAASRGAAFVWTVASGGVPVGYYGLNRAAVFTPEVADDARRRGAGIDVHVIPARIDFGMLDSPVVAGARAIIRQRLSIQDADLVIARVARTAGVYLRSIRAGLALARRFNREGRRAMFLHAGYVHERDAAETIRRLVEAENDAAGRAVAHTVTDDVALGARYAAAADICIGSGRSAIEALALARPTLIAWGSRYLGLVDTASVGAIAATNFQGRHSATTLSDDEVVARMYDDVCRRLAEPDQGRRTQASCARVVRDRYSVESSVDTYERLYADRTVTVDGFFRHYGNPHHLWRALFHRLPAGIRRSRVVKALKRARGED